MQEEFNTYNTDELEFLKENLENNLDSNNLILCDTVNFTNVKNDHNSKDEKYSK